MSLDCKLLFYSAEGLLAVVTAPIAFVIVVTVLAVVLVVVVVLLLRTVVAVAFVVLVRVAVGVLGTSDAAGPKLYSQTPGSV